MRVMLCDALVRKISYIFERNIYEDECSKTMEEFRL